MVRQLMQQVCTSGCVGLRNCGIHLFKKSETLGCVLYKHLLLIRYGETIGKIYYVYRQNSKPTMQFLHWPHSASGTGQHQLAVKQALLLTTSRTLTWLPCSGELCMGAWQPHQPATTAHQTADRLAGAYRDED